MAQRSLRMEAGPGFPSGPHCRDLLPPAPVHEISRRWERERAEGIDLRHVVPLVFSRDAITKMKDVYLKNPQMGDPASLDHKLAEVGQNIEKLRLEAQKFEVRESRRGKAWLGKKTQESGEGHEA